MLYAHLLDYFKICRYSDFLFRDMSLFPVNILLFPARFHPLIWTSHVPKHTDELTVIRSDARMEPNSEASQINEICLKKQNEKTTQKKKSE